MWTVTISEGTKWHEKKWRAERTAVFSVRTSERAVCGTTWTKMGWQKLLEL
jgi:hypothetical protein